MGTHTNEDVLAFIDKNADTVLLVAIEEVEDGYGAFPFDITDTLKQCLSSSPDSLYDHKACLEYILNHQELDIESEAPKIVQASERVTEQQARKEYIGGRTVDFDSLTPTPT